MHSINEHKAAQKLQYLLYMTQTKKASPVDLLYYKTCCANYEEEITKLPPLLLEKPYILPGFFTHSVAFLASAALLALLGSGPS